MHKLSAKFFFSTGMPENLKKLPFLAKKLAFFADFAEILGIDKNHLNTSYVRILGHLGPFLAKYGNFIDIFGPFWPI